MKMGKRSTRGQRPTKQMWPNEMNQEAYLLVPYDGKIDLRSSLFFIVFLFPVRKIFTYIFFSYNLKHIPT
jgi:hypothetical protein